MMCLKLLYTILSLGLMSDVYYSTAAAASTSSTDKSELSSPLFDFTPNATNLLLQRFDDLLRDPKQAASVIQFNTSRLLFFPHDNIGIEDEVEGDDLTFQYRLANIKIFVPLSGGRGADDALAAFLAIHQFHDELERSTNVNSASSSCNIRLSATVVDTGGSPIQATQSLNRILHGSGGNNDRTIGNSSSNNNSSSSITTDYLSSFTDDSLYPVSAILGAFHSAVTSPLAVLSGLEGVVQISHASTAVGLDVKEQYPYLGRTVPSSLGEATAALDFLQQRVKVTTHLAIIFVTDAFGSSLEKLVTQLAQERGMETQSYAVPSFLQNEYDSATHQESLISVMQKVKSSDLKHIYAICSEQELESWFLAAEKADLLGEDYFWFFPGLDIDGLLTEQSNRDSSNGNFTLQLHGSAILQMQGGVTTNVRYLGRDELDNEGGLVNGLLLDQSGYAQFVDLWREAIADDQFMDYVKGKVGQGDDNTDYYYSSWPGSVRPFMFDATMSLGRALCAAQGVNGSEVLNGTDIFDAFRNEVYLPQGASGEVRIVNETGSRDHKTVRFVVWNPQEIVDEDGKSLLALVPTTKYMHGSWKTIEDRTFLFRDGTSLPPSALGEVSINYHMLGSASRAVGFTLSTLLGLMVFGVWIWTFIHRAHPIIRRSNYIFLCILTTGALILSTATFLLGMDQRTTSSIEALNASCMAAPYVYFGALSLIVGPLFTKTLALYRAFINPEQKHLDAPSTKIVFTTILLLAMNMIVLVVWTILSPLEWVRDYDSSKDRYGRSIESYGSCQSKNSHLFYIALIAINASIIITAIWFSFRARNIETEYGESAYIAIAQVGILQSWCVGVPLLAAVQDNPQGRFLIEAVIIFLTSTGVVLFIYVPKIEEMRRSKIQRRKSRMTGLSATRPNNGKEFENLDQSEHSCTNGSH